jgi:hypothetical protein
MPWTPPRTWIPYELVTDTMLNTHVRDNFNAVNRVVRSMINPAGIPNTGAGVNTTLYSYVIPAGMLITDGDTLKVTTFGYVVTAGDQKAFALSLAGNQIASTGIITGEGQWCVSVEIRRSGATTVFINSLVMIQGTMTAPSIAAFSGTPWAGAVQLDFIGWATAPNDVKLFSVIIDLKRAGTGV